MHERLKILVRAPNWLGDHVMASDFYIGLRKAFPHAHVTLVCPTEFVQLAEGFDEVIELPKRHRKLVGGWSFWRKRIREKKFDACVLLTASWSSAILARATGIALRVGYAETGAGWLLTRSAPWLGRESGKHKAQLYREVLELLGMPAASSAVPSRRSEGVYKDIVLAPGASITLRQWPGFIELAQSLRVKFPEAVIRLVGTPAQKTWGERASLLRDPQIEDWVGRTDLKQLVQMCSQARLVVANDSGVAHLAARTGVPTVVLFGPGDPAYVTPLGDQVRVARVGNLACSPCEKPYCRAPYGYQACLKTLTVEQVLSSLTGSG